MLLTDARDFDHVVFLFSTVCQLYLWLEIFVKVVRYGAMRDEQKNSVEFGASNAKV